MNAKSLWSRLRPYCVTAPLTLAAGGLAYYCQIKAPDTAKAERLDFWIIDASLQEALLWIGIGCTLIAMGTPTYAALSYQRKARAAIKELGDASVVMVDIATPIVSLIGELTDLPDKANAKRANLQGQVKVTVVAALATYFDESHRVRACYLSLDGSSPQRKLTVAASWGRPIVRSDVFDENTPEGKELFQSIDAERAVHWTSKRRGGHPPSWSEADPFAAYISVPVATQDRVFGLLTLDAQVKDAFAIPRDIRTAEMLARHLAVALNC